MAEPCCINHLLFTNNEIKWEHGGVLLLSLSLHHPWVRRPQHVAEGEGYTWQSTRDTPRGQVLLGEVRGPSLGLLMPLSRGKDQIVTSGMYSLKEPALHLQRHLLSLLQFPIFFFFFCRKVFFAVGGAGCAVVAWDPRTSSSFWARYHDFTG